MALFPAYGNKTNAEATKTDTDQKWLNNSSFQVDVNVLEKLQQPTEIGECSKHFKDDLNDICDAEKVLEINSDSSTEKPAKKKRKKHKKQKSHKKDSVDIKLVQEVPESDEFRIDKTRTAEFLRVPTISRPSVPRYHRSYYITNFKRRKNDGKFERYFNCVIETKKAEITINRANLDKLPTTKDDNNDNFTGFKQEEELSKSTAEFNRYLAENAQDVKKWLEYIHFQDTVYNFEKTYRKGSMAKALRVLAERKLAILDKALSQNPESEELMRLRLIIEVQTFPADELQQHLKKLVEKEQGNLILWQGYIEAFQCSMSHCNTPTVLNLYTKCLGTLHKLRRNSILQTTVLEESILRILYQCGLFLKQAGLFEQLWTLLSMYLDLNLQNNSGKESFQSLSTSHFEKSMEDDLVELEEVIFKSQLPLHELWLRTEKLRESCHFLPVSNLSDNIDPQRLILPDDVQELIHPITMPQNLFRMIATVFSLLKIPLLPSRHTIMNELGLDYVPWALDSIEPLLPLFFNQHSLNLDNKNLLNCNKLTVGPQYLKSIPGQESYLNFLLKIMTNCAANLNDRDKIAVTVWWFRFQRLLLILAKENRFKVNRFEKIVKNNCKNLLKLPENRNNYIFYVEYALIEKELSKSESALAILDSALNFAESIEAKTFIYRNILEIHLENNLNINSSLLNIFCKYFDAAPVNDLEKRFKLSFLKLPKNTVFEAIDNFLPNYYLDFIQIYCWFIYLNNGPIEAGTFLENVLESIPVSAQMEIIYELYVAMLFKYCTANPGKGVVKILDSVLHRGIELFPNNLFLLSILAKSFDNDKVLGQKQWWTVKNLLTKSGRAYSILFTALIAEQRIQQMENAIKDTITGDSLEISSGMKNQMLSLYKNITSSDFCTRRCGLVWRLYLQFVYQYFPPDVCRNVYYTAVEECPWIKSLYMDAAIYIPAELPQIQDLIIEKQLRLHVTPEELEVLRS